MRSNPEMEKQWDSKVIAGAIASYVAVVLAALGSQKLGVEIDATALQTVLIPLIVPIVTLATGWFKRDQRFEQLLDWKREVEAEGLAGAYEPTEGIDPKQEQDL